MLERHTRIASTGDVDKGFIRPTFHPPYCPYVCILPIHASSTLKHHQQIDDVSLSIPFPTTVHVWTSSWTDTHLFVYAQDTLPIRCLHGSIEPRRPLQRERRDQVRGSDEGHPL